jgi:hypothetical protein
MRSNGRAFQVEMGVGSHFVFRTLLNRIDPGRPVDALTLDEIVANLFRGDLERDWLPKPNPSNPYGTKTLHLCNRSR